MKWTQPEIRELDGWQREFIDSLPELRKRKLLGFIEELVLAKRSHRTIRHYVWAITSLGRDGKPYGRLTRNDFVNWMQSLENNGHAPRTIRDLRAGVKRFMRWVHKDNETAQKAMEVLKVPVLRRELPKDILTRKEIQKLLDVCGNQRDRTFVFALYESGGRLGEILGLKINDISIDKYGAAIAVSGKTGGRRIRLIESVPDIQLWLSMHPDKDNPGAPLWPNLCKPTERLGEDGAQFLLRRLAERGGIKKRVHPHLLRHSRATHLAKVLTEAQLREFFGWTKRSDMPSIYVHLSGRDVDEGILKYYGKKPEEPEPACDGLTPKKCPRCRLENPSTARFCSKCSCALDPKSAMEHLETARQADELVAKVVNELIRRAPELVEQAVMEHQAEFQQISEKVGSAPSV